MAPTSIAGKSETPRTPTRTGKKPDPSITPKLASTANSNKPGAMSTTPRKPPKLGPPKSASKIGNSPNLPPRSKSQEASKASENLKDRKGHPNSFPDSGSLELRQKIGMKDNEKPENPTGTSRELENDTDGESTSIADTNELSEANPEPVQSEDDEEETATHPEESANNVARDLGTESERDYDSADEEEEEDEAEEADNEDDQSALSGVKSTLGGFTGGAKSMTGRATGGAKNTATKAARNFSNGNVTGAAEDATGNLKDTTTGATGDIKDTAGETTNNVKKTATGVVNDVPKSKDDVPSSSDNIQQKAKQESDEVQDAVQDTVGDTKDIAENTGDDVGDAAIGFKDSAEKAVKGTEDDVFGAEQGVKRDQEEGGYEEDEEDEEDDSDDKEAEEQTQEQLGDIKDQAEDTTDDVSNRFKDVADHAEDDIVDNAEENQAQAEDRIEHKKDQAPFNSREDEDTTADETYKVRDTAQGASSDLPTDLKILKGLKVRESGDVLNDDGEVIGKLEDGDPDDLHGYEVGDNGEILDEDGDVIGRVNLITNQAKDAAKEAGSVAEGEVDIAEDSAPGSETYLPDIDVLKGLEVQANGDILDQNGNVLGRITEGDSADLVGMTLNEDGEVLDEDGDVIGRAEVLPQEIRHEVEEAKDDVQEPGLNVLDGLKVDQDGAIKDSKGNTLGRIIEGDPEDLAGRILNADGEVLDEDGDVIGRAEVVPEANKAIEDTTKEAQEISPEAQKVKKLQQQLEPNLDILEGRKLNKKGNILDDDGEVLARLVEGDPAECRGQIPDENGEILDKNGNVIGRVEVVDGDAAEEAMKEVHPELVQELEEAQQAVGDADKAAAGAEDAERVAEGAAGPAKDELDKANNLADFTQLEGLKVNKKGEVVNEDGDPIARLVEGEIDNVRGQKINDKGEILDSDGNILGKVDFIQEATEADIVNDEQEDNEKLPTSVLEGLKVNKRGEVLNEDGDVVAKLSKGELDTVAGKKLNGKGQVLDKDGHVIGEVEMIEQAGEEAAEEDSREDEEGTGDDLPPLFVLEGCKLNKTGKVVDKTGNIVGELVDGDAKKIWKLGLAADDQGQFWNNKGRVIGKAKTLAAEDESSEGPFAGLDGLTVVKDGWVEDENGNRVGQLTEGDKKKLIGRAVDEDGDIIDKKGNVVGHAERYEEPEEEAEQPEVEVDFSELKGLSCNKQGNVIGQDGVPIGRLVQGNAKQLAGRKIDGNGQIWNDSGEVVGKCELIPPEEREDKPEGPFAGLEGLLVVKDGFVEDNDGNVVGKVTDGNWKKLLGRGVDEDGDIVDKYGNVKGHAEPFEVPEEEEEAPKDLSSLAGKTVNKQGKLVDEHGTIFGEVIEGDTKRLVGRKCDGQGQIWSNDGKVIGKGGLIAGGDNGQADGPFSNFESTIVGKDGLVKESSGDIVGRVVEGDPKKLVGRKVDDDGDIVDKNGNVIGKAERWEPEEKERESNPMAGLHVNKEGEVRDKNGDTVGRLTDGNLLHCIGREIDDNGNVVDQDGNKLGEVTLLENIPQEEVEVEEGPTEEELKEQEEREVAKKIGNIIQQTIEKMEPICKQIDEHIDKADRTPRDELDEEALVQNVKPLIEEGSRHLQECNGSIRGLDPDGSIAAKAKARAASGEASPEQHRVAEGLKELTTNIVKTIDNAKKKIVDMPHAKKKLSPLWALLTEPLFQIIAAVGLLLAGVLNLVGRLLNGLGLGGLVNGVLGGLGIDKMLNGLGLGSIGEALGLGGGKKKK